MSDNYLIHWAKGKEAKNHKYSAREWVNGKWQYIYGVLGGNKKQQYEDAKSDYDNYQSTVRREASKRQTYNALQDTSKSHYNKSLAYKNSANYAEQSKRFHTSMGNEATRAMRGYYGQTQDPRYETRMRDLASRADMNYRLAREAGNDYKKYSEKAEEWQRNSESAANASNKYYNQNYDKVLATNVGKANNVRKAELAYRSTPLYAATTAINAGKKFLSKLFSNKTTTTTTTSSNTGYNGYYGGNGKKRNTN